MDLGAPTECSTGGGSDDDRMGHFSVGKGERAHDAPFTDISYSSYYLLNLTTTNKISSSDGFPAEPHLRIASHRFHFHHSYSSSSLASSSGPFFPTLHFFILHGEKSLFKPPVAYAGYWSGRTAQAFRVDRASSGFS